jgi:hypothetical protein
MVPENNCQVINSIGEVVVGWGFVAWCFLVIDIRHYWVVLCVLYLEGQVDGVS